MNNQVIKSIKKYLPIVAGALTVLLGAAFIIAVSHLYFTGGDTPYSRERAGEYLLWLLPISIVTILSYIVGGVFAFLEKSENPKLRGAISEKVSLQRIYKRYRVTAVDRDSIGSGDKSLLADPKSYERISFEHKIRRVSSIGTAIFFVSALLAGGLILAPLLDLSQYPSDDLATPAAMAFSWALLVSISLGISLYLIREFVSESYAYEAKLLKEIIASGKFTSAPIKKPEGKSADKIVRISARAAVFAVALVFIILGAIFGNIESVLSKAIAICTECIGLG